MTPVVTLFEAALQEELNAITGRGRHVVYGQAHLRPVLAFLRVMLSNGTAYSTYFEQPRPRGGHWKMWKQLTRLSLVWKTVGGVAKPFFNETQGKPCGGRRPSGLGQPTGKSAGPGQDPLQDGRPHPEPSGGGVRHHLDLLQQSPQQQRGRRRHRLDMGPAEKRRYPGDVKAPGDKKEDVFYFYFVYLYSICGLVVSRGECRSR